MPHIKLTEDTLRSAQILILESVAPSDIIDTILSEGGVHFLCGAYIFAGVSLH